MPDFKDPKYRPSLRKIVEIARAKGVFNIMPLYRNQHMRSRADKAVRLGLLWSEHWPNDPKRGRKYYPVGVPGAWPPIPETLDHKDKP